MREINYDAQRKSSTYSPIDLHIHELLHIADGAIATAIVQNNRIIHKKFSYCIDLFKLSKLPLPQFQVIDSINPDRDLTSTPTAFYEYKVELECIVFLMRRILDTLVTQTSRLTSCVFTKKNRQSLTIMIPLGKLLKHVI